MRGGLKKCVPSQWRRKSSLRPSASEAMGMPEVFRADDCAGPPHRVDFLEQRALDLGLLDDRFDDPVAPRKDRRSLSNPPIEISARASV
jgi:hypothetical protein